MGRLGSSFVGLLFGGLAWTQLLELTHSSVAYPVVLLGGGLGALLIGSRIVTRMFLPYEGLERRWRGLRRAAPALELRSFGGHHPPEASLRRGRARVQILPKGDGFDLWLRLDDTHPAPPDLHFDGRRPGRLDVDVGDARLDGHVAMGGPDAALLAALTPEVRDGLAAHVVGREAWIEPGRAFLRLSDPLRRPKGTLARLDGLIELLEALDAAVGVPVEEALATSDPCPSVTAARLRVRARGPELDLDAARSYLDHEAPAVRWAVSEALTRAPDPSSRLEGLRLVRAALAGGDRAARRHAFEVLGRGFPRPVARREARRDVFGRSTALLPEALRLLTDEDLASPAFLARLDDTGAAPLQALVPRLVARGAEPALVHLAHRREASVALDALDALGRVGSLACVPALLSLARALRTPARRGAALLVARRLQARFGHPAEGALSRVEVEVGRLSQPVN